MFVTLSDYWLKKAIAAGHARQEYAEANSKRPYGDDRRGQWLEKHIVGCITECCVAKTLKRPWDPQIGKTGGTDIDGVAEVRARRVPGTGLHLAIRPDDKNDKPYVLVHFHLGLRMESGRSELIGWLYGREGKGRGELEKVKKVWFIPPPYHSVESLIEEFALVV